MKLATNLLLIALSSLSFSQEKKDFLFDNKDSLFVLTQAGMSFQLDSCERSLQKKFGFKTVGIGCLVFIEDQILNNNTKSQINRLNGKDWQIRYAKELAICRKKQTK